MKVYFPGGKRVSAEYRGHTIETDQKVESGGENLYSSPFDLFKASLGTCMGAYVMMFCAERQIPLDSVTLELEFSGEGVIENVHTKINVDDRFPAKYSKAIIKATNSCKVKRQMLAPPSFSTEVNPVS